MYIFRLEKPFMNIRQNRCTSGPTSQKSYTAFNFESAKKTFFWFSLGENIYES